MKHRNTNCWNNQAVAPGHEFSKKKKERERWGAKESCGSTIYTPCAKHKRLPVPDRQNTITRLCPKLVQPVYMGRLPKIIMVIVSKDAQSLTDKTEINIYTKIYSANLLRSQTANTIKTYAQKSTRSQLGEHSHAQLLIIKSMKSHELNHLNQSSSPL